MPFPINNRDILINQWISEIEPNHVVILLFEGNEQKIPRKNGIIRSTLICNF